jgi:homoserine dehydrogenase
MARLRIGLIGWGTVGSALGRLVAAGPLPLDMACVAVRHPAAARGIPLPDGVAVVAPEEVAAAGLDAVVELAGGVEEPLGWARTALAASTPYVTANKALLANHGDALSTLARQHGAALLASASVGGGVPMLETVHHLAATRAIGKVRGILNATTTYMLTAMGEGLTYGDALREAQTAGYAEADPSLDVDGRDAAQKLAILASEAWGEWRSETQVERHGIRGLEVGEGQVIRLIAEATEERLAVTPLEVEPDSALATISGVENLLEIDVRAGGIFRISGPGAGGRVTAGAVYADLARLAAGERPILFGGSA